MKVPFLDLKSQYQSIRQEVLPAIETVTQQCAFAAGPHVAAFEQKFAPYCQSRHAVGVGSGTSALWLALQALGIGHGDEVVTVPNTFIATIAAIRFAGARPVLVDVDPQTFTMDPRRLEEAITPRTKAVIPVHLFGQVCDMDPILEIAREHSLKVIEDAAQAHGAEYKGRRAGSFGDAGCFSFYPGKNLGAYGEAGAVVTNHDHVAEVLRMLVDHGQRRKYHHERLGWNGRMDGIQGAVLGVKMNHIEAWTEARRTNAHRYEAALGSLDWLTLPWEAPGRRHVYHLYVVRAADREDVMAALREQDVACGIHYPIPVHLQDACRDLGYTHGCFPVAERTAAEFISLPMYPELTEAQIEHVARALRAYPQRGRLAA